MKLDWIDPEHGPTPEQLGAYADGELTNADRAAVEAWLDRQPALAAEVDEWQRLTQLWRDTPPPPPAPGAWATVGNEIKARLRAPSQPTVPSALPRFGWLVAAAAVLALVFLGKGNGPVSATEEPYPVVSAEDVDILSIAGMDCDYLAGAKPPVCRIEAHELATSDDVVVLNWDDLKAAPRFDNNGPWLVTPNANWQRDP
jgi:hypothetical protein